MQLYMEYSTNIYNVYLKYVAPEDIHVYSIDEVFIDITNYFELYKLSPYQMAEMIIKDVFKTTGITATVGIGTNLYLAKVAMDIHAKSIEADKDGGTYITVAGKLKKIDEYEESLVIEDGREILIKDIVKIDCELFSSL